MSRHWPTVSRFDDWMETITFLLQFREQKKGFSLRGKEMKRKAIDCLSKINSIFFHGSLMCRSYTIAEFKMKKIKHFFVCYKFDGICNFMLYLRCVRMEHAIRHTNTPLELRCFFALKILIHKFAHREQHSA